MAQLQHREPGTVASCLQVLAHLEQAHVLVDHLGDRASATLIDTLQRVYRARAGIEVATHEASSAADALRVHFFGACEAFYGGVPLGGWRKKSEALFKYLVYHRATPIHRDQLLDLFWRDSTPEAARNCLNVTLHALRRSLGEAGLRAADQFIAFAAERYRVTPVVEIWTDVDAFNEALARGHEALARADHAQALGHFELAAALYRGDFLMDDRYEEWTAGPRERLRNSYLDLLAGLGRAYGDAGRHTAALECGRKLLEFDSCSEDGHRQVMTSYLALGQRVLALRQYRLCCETLERELGVAPMPATTALYDQIRAG